MLFKEFQLAIQRQFNVMKKLDLYRVSLDKDQLWETYLKSFPEGTNPIFRERTEHDCQCCRSFIRSVSNMVAIVDGKLITLWDCKVGGFYQVVADALAAFVKSHPIENVFLHTENSAGKDQNIEETEDGKLIKWEHFFIQLPSELTCKGIDIGTRLGETRTTRDMMLRALKEIKVDAIETVLDLIKQNSLYRGEENKFAVEAFLKLKKQFDAIGQSCGQCEYRYSDGRLEKCRLYGNNLSFAVSDGFLRNAPCQTFKEDLFCWANFNKIPQSVTRIRNTAIGTLLTDLSELPDYLEDAVKSFEAKVAPQNYKRPTSLITKAMIDNAKKKLDDLGLTSALERRYAVLEDITINNVLFANRTAKKRMDSVFDELAAQMPDNVKSFDKVEEITIEKFIADVLPKAETLEVMFENRHQSNLVSLVAPVDLTSKTMFKWHNNFSWSYTGEVADSIKERVKTAGGNVDGDLRCSLSWFNYDDLDLHMIEPNGYHIYFGQKNSHTTRGCLDVDMNAGGGKTRNAVENITYPDRKHMAEGVYTLKVNNFCKRENQDVGFDIEVEFDGKVFSFHQSQAVPNSSTVTAAQIKYSRKDGFEMLTQMSSTQPTKTVWGLPTQTFHKASVVMLSPNHWDEKATGNKHYFFMLENCINETTARGFFNEFLKPELDQHRKVFEVVGSKMKVDSATNQLSGLGFSSTNRNNLVVRVKGSFSRTLKIIF